MCKCWTGTRKEILLPWGWRCCTSALCRGRKKTESEGISKSLWPPAGRSLRPHRPWLDCLLPHLTGPSGWGLSSATWALTGCVSTQHARQAPSLRQLPNYQVSARAQLPCHRSVPISWNGAHCVFVSEKGVRLRRGSGGECWQYRDSRRTKNLRRNTNLIDKCAWKSGSKGTDFQS